MKEINLIERYVSEVDRYLPHKKRADIQAELRSLLVDSLEDRAAGEDNDTAVVALLKEFGPPRSVAAGYYPDRQYLIGPALYPLFRLVMGITLAAVSGAQFLAWGVATFIASDPFSPWEALFSLLNSLPAAVGMVVIVFAILQWLDVRPDQEEKPWAPRMLPQIYTQEPVKTGERIFEIVVDIIILAILALFPGKIGFVTTIGGEFFANPVITQYLVWLGVGLLASVGVNLYLLRQGRWTNVARIAKIGVNLFSIVILIVLVQGHNDWLAAQGAGGFLDTLQSLHEDILAGSKLIGMQAFRMAFTIAALVTAIDTMVLFYQLVRANLARKTRHRSLKFSRITPLKQIGKTA